VRPVLAWNRHCYRLAADQLDSLCLDDRIEHERASRQPLAIVTMTAVDEHRPGEKLVADGAAGATASKFFAMLTDKRSALVTKSKMRQVFQTAKACRNRAGETSRMEDHKIAGKEEMIVSKVRTDPRTDPSN
jgi:hypothetical protein